MKTEQLIILTILMFSSVSAVSANTIDVFYPHNNTTTFVCYCNDSGYYYSQSNTIEFDDTVTSVLLKNQIEYIDVVNNPIKILTGNAPVLIFFALIFSVLFVSLAKLLKRY